MAGPALPRGNRNRESIPARWRGRPGDRLLYTLCHPTHAIKSGRCKCLPLFYSLSSSVTLPTHYKAEVVAICSLHHPDILSFLPQQIDPLTTACLRHATVGAGRHRRSTVLWTPIVFSYIESLSLSLTYLFLVYRPPLFPPCPAADATANKHGRLSVIHIRNSDGHSSIILLAAI